MLTRLKVTSFKNLVDVDVRFGPFTCVAGANGVGKSNLFDAIRFLAALADRPLLEAARSVRDERRTGDVRSLFHRVGDVPDRRMTFVAEMIVPPEGKDDLGQLAKATITFLRYTVELALRGADDPGSDTLELLKEELVHINIGEAPHHLLFPHKRAWRNTVVKGRRVGAFFISTVGEGDNRVILLHQDGGSRGRPLPRSAANLPRTVLSATNAAESPTALLARREMQSWRLLQLEPSALRKPDDFTATPRLGADGSHLPATLYRLARSATPTNGNGTSDGTVYGRVVSRLSELIPDVRQIWIDRDERRELLNLQVIGANGTIHPARALSDGTLRFLALAVLELDPEAQGVLCLEEPENGIHPERIPAMLKLLQSIAVDPDEPVGPDNPLRQVIVNTHSPAVVQQIPDDSLLIAESRETVRDGLSFKRACFCPLPDTWRAKAAPQLVVPKGRLLAYLNPVPNADPDQSTARPRRVRDRPDLQPLLPFPDPDPGS